MHVFMTGATGFIGQALARELRGHGHRVGVLVRDPQSPAALRLAERGCEAVPGDVTRADALAEAMAGVDAVVHAAGRYEIGVTPEAAARMHAANVQGTANVLAAAHAMHVPRTLYVSSVWALGDSGGAERDERHRHDGRVRTAYEGSKLEAHAVALRWRARGLPLVIAMPNAVVGANDHSVFGYYLRLYLMHALPPIAWGRGMVLRPVDVDALADGLARALEQAPIGADYHFGGPPQTTGDIFAHWGTHDGGATPRLWLPRGLARWQMGLMEPLLRALGLPAFLSREAVDMTAAHLDYHSERAERELGWTHPDPATMWDQIVLAERTRMARHRGWREQLRHEAVG